MDATENWPGSSAQIRQEGLNIRSCTQPAKPPTKYHSIAGYTSSCPAGGTMPIAVVATDCQGRPCPPQQTEFPRRLQPFAGGLAPMPSPPFANRTAGSCHWKRNCGSVSRKPKRRSRVFSRNEQFESGPGATIRRERIRGCCGTCIAQWLVSLRPCGRFSTPDSFADIYQITG